MTTTKTNNTIALLFFIITFYSCNNSQKEFYENGNLKAKHYLDRAHKKDSSVFYYKDGTVESIMKFLNDKKQVENYYNNGSIESIGSFQNDTIPVGNWKYFYDNGELQEVKEFLKINGKPFLNQNWFLNVNGDTIKSQSNYFNLLLEKDTILINEPVKAKIDLIGPYFKDKNSSIMVILPKEYSDNFNSDFSNLNGVQLDTTFNLNLDMDMRKALNIESDFRKTSVFGRYFETPGIYNFRGILVEYYYTKNGIPDSLNNNYYEKKQYFDTQIYIKDTN